MNGKKRVLLAGNANVGKSTVFNEITGSHRHTGNWTGKTVDIAKGHYYYKFNDYEIIDLPGTYSLLSVSEEERIASDMLREKDYDCVVCVVDAALLERNLNLVLQVLNITDRAVLLLNLCDEAAKKCISVDEKALSDLLGIPVVKATARSGKGINELLEEVHLICTCSAKHSPYRIEFDAPENSDKETAEIINAEAKRIADKVVFSLPSKKERREELLDKILLGKRTGIPVMLLIIGVVLWITIIGSNYPSELLRGAFDSFELWLAGILLKTGMSDTAVSFLVFGIIKVLLWVVAVMLPPMAIFFPLFSLLEDFGFLPRLAFNLDGAFECCGACGKQALTTCMGYGCNAVGITGCRIIDSPRERLVAIITNSLTPCNGRFPLLIAVISMFFTKNSVAAALVLLSFLVVSMLATFLLSKILSSTVLKGEPSSFVLELPSFRKPRLRTVLADTVREKVLIVLLRAIAVSAPAGAVIWVLSNIRIGDASLLVSAADFLDPIGRFIGLDGVMLIAFLLGFPANEIVIPIALMAYLSTGVMKDYTTLDSLKTILTDNGWTVKTAICTCVFSMFHFPCSTSLITIFKETKSAKWTALSVLCPLITGVLICAAINQLI